MGSRSEHGLYLNFDWILKCLGHSIFEKLGSDSGLVWKILERNLLGILRLGYKVRLFGCETRLIWLVTWKNLDFLNIFNVQCLRMGVKLVNTIFLMVLFLIVRNNSFKF